MHSRWALAALVLSVSAPVWAALEDATPTGGANITTRKCVGGGDAGNRCRQDSDCDSGDCFDFNLVDLTFNFLDTAGNPWSPTAAQLATIQGYFPAVNNALADSTDGQMCLGTMALVVNNGAPNAVVQLMAGQCRAGLGICLTDADCGAGDTCNVGGGSTNTGGWGSDGKITIGIGCLQNPRCFNHEFMHLVANVRDEYEGALDDGVNNDGDSEIDECNENQANFRCFGGSNDGQPCTAAANCPGGACRRIVCIDSGGTDPTSVTGCLMQCCLNNTGNELCWSGNHDPNVDTEQSQCRSNLSCWDQFEDEWPSLMLAPAGGPVAGPAVSPCKLGFLTPSVLDRFVAVIDRSGSMEEESPRRIDVAVTTVQDFIDLLDDGVEFGLASFASVDADADPPDVDATKDFPATPGLQALNSTADRTSAKTATGGLSSRAGGFTRIGAGLRQGRSMLLESGGTVTLNTTVLLLTDGINNRPEDDPQTDLDAALAELAADNIPVFVTCIGEGRDSTQCSYIADQTAGRFVDSADTASLYDAFVEFAAEAQGHGISAAQLGTPIAENQLSDPVAALVEAGTQTVKFVISWTHADSDLDLRLFRPDGTQVPDSEKTVGTQGEFFRIDNPAAGVWNMRVFGTDIPQSTDHFSARALLDHRKINVAASLARSTVQWPEGFLVSANPTMGLAITDCEVHATVTKPDGSTELISLHDDGENGDKDREDGLYQAIYKNFTAGDGIYTFAVDVSCREGVAGFHQHDDPGVGSFPGLPKLVSFDRQLRFSGTVSGVPDNLPPIAHICQDVRAECEGVTTSVQLDGTCSTDPEGEALAYQWNSPTGTFLDPNVAQPTGMFPLGRNDVNLTVKDPHGVASVPPDTGLVVIADTIAPVVQVSLSTTELWPPNHRLVEVSALVTVQEVCDPLPTIQLASIVSDEPDDAPGTGDGNTIGDVQDALLGSDDRRFLLRAERDGRGDGRTYTVTYAVTDASGNVGFGSATVSVPHDHLGATDDVVLTLGKQEDTTLVLWDPVPGAVAYHVIRGQLSSIRETDAEIDLGIVTCTRMDAAPATDVDAPPAGSALFYLTEYETAEGQRSSFGEERTAKPRAPSSPCP